MKHGLERPLLLVAVAIVLAFAWLKPLEIAATHQVDAGLKRALVSFATARALNAIISVAQGTEIAVEPAGVGQAPERAAVEIDGQVHFRTRAGRPEQGAHLGRELRREQETVQQRTA